MSALFTWPEARPLVGHHVTLRPIARTDRDGLLEAFATGFDHSFAATVPGPSTIDAFLDTAEAEIAVGRARPFTVLNAQGQIVGTTRFMRMNGKHKRVEIGNTLYNPSVRRTGVNTEAKRLLLAHAFEDLGVHCVQLRTDTLNLASRRAIERLGARLDGILRGHMVITGNDGVPRRRDTVVYSILDIEWPGVRRHLDGLMAAYG